MRTPPNPGRAPSRKNSRPASREPSVHGAQGQWHGQWLHGGSQHAENYVARRLASLAGHGAGGAEGGTGSCGRLAELAQRASVAVSPGLSRDATLYGAETVAGLLQEADEGEKAATHADAFPVDVCEGDGDGTAERLNAAS